MPEPKAPNPKSSCASLKSLRTQLPNIEAAFPAIDFFNLRSILNRTIKQCEQQLAANQKES